MFFHVNYAPPMIVGASGYEVPHLKVSAKPGVVPHWK